MSAIKKKFILDGAVDGNKILLLNGDSLKAKDALGNTQELMKLDMSGVFKLLKMPQVPSAPVESDDISSKGYVDGQVSGEAAARTKADNSLQGQIDTEKGRIDAILLSADADKDSFAEIVSLINSVDTENDSAFGSYVISNNAALAQETKDRQAGDTALSARLDTLEADPTSQASVTAAIAVETTRATGAEQALSGRLDVLEADPVTQQYVDDAIADEQDVRDAEITAVEGRLDIIEGDNTVEGSVAKAQADAQSFAQSLVDTEADGREAADENLQGQINTEKGRIDAILSASDADKDSFAEIVALINSVDTANDSAFGSYVISNNAALAQETKDRQAADTGLSARLDTLEVDPTSKGYVDGQVSGEAAARVKADNALDGRLQVLEADPTTKAYVDGQISSEQAARQKQVDALDARLDVLEAVTFHNEMFTLSSGDVDNGYIELSMEALPYSTTVFVDRLGAHEGEDYTVSVVEGKTRLTWIGELEPEVGDSALAAGDKVYVKFAE